MRKAGFWIGIFVILAVMLFPIVWVYVTSFKPSEDILTYPPKLAFSPTLDNYNFIFFMRPTLLEFRNSLIIAITSTALVMAVALPAAYSFARWNTGSGHLLFVTISTRMFPGAVAAIPFFLLFRNLGLLDTHIGLIALFLYFNMSFATFLLFGFFREVPVELEQAAMVDGYGRLDVFRKVVFPLIKPGAVITTIFCLVWAWNEFFFSLLFTRVTATPVSVGLSRFWGAVTIEWGAMAAMMSLAILPTLLIAWFMQRYIIRGLTFGAVKG